MRLIHLRYFRGAKGGYLAIYPTDPVSVVFSLNVIRTTLSRLTKHAVNDLAVHIGETHIAAAKAERQLLVVHAQQVQHRGV